MITSLWHPRGCGVDVYYTSMTQCNVHECWLTYLTLHRWIFRGHISHIKWNRSWSRPFVAVANPSIAIHVITIIIWALEMTNTRRTFEWDLKIILDISFFGCALRVSATYFVHVIYGMAIRPCNSHFQMAQHKKITIKRWWQILDIMNINVV